MKKKTRRLTTWEMEVIRAALQREHAAQDSQWSKDGIVELEQAIGNSTGLTIHIRQEGE